MTDEERQAIVAAVTVAMGPLIAPLQKSIDDQGKRLDSIDSRLGITEARWFFVQDSLTALEARLGTVEGALTALHTGQTALTEQLYLMQDEQAGLGGAVTAVGGQVGSQMTVIHAAILEVKARLDRLSKDLIVGSTRDRERLAKLERDVAALQARLPPPP